MFIDQDSLGEDVSETPETRKKNQFVGLVSHYYPRAGVAAMACESDVKLGDMLHFLGETTDFEEEITSMQIDHEQITKAWAGDQIGIKVSARVREGDEVYKKIRE